jgi:hypothetical protein
MYCHTCRRVLPLIEFGWLVTLLYRVVPWRGLYNRVSVHHQLALL